MARRDEARFARFGSNPNSKIEKAESTMPEYQERNKRHSNEARRENQTSGYQNEPIYLHDLPKAENYNKLQEESDERIFRRILGKDYKLHRDLDRDEEPSFKPEPRKRKFNTRRSREHDLHISLLQQEEQETERTYRASGETPDVSSSTLDIESLSPVEKLTKAIEASGKYLGEAVVEELKAVFTPATLATMIGVFGIYIAAHATGVGQAADILMLLAGGVFFGLDTISIFKDIAGFGNAINATTEEDIEKAGKHLADLVATISVDLLMTLLTSKVAEKISKGVDNLSQVDEVHAHSDGANAGRVNDIDNADKTLSAGNEVTPTTANNIEYPEGISYRQDLPKHLRDFDGIGKNGIGGTHNLDIFNQIVAEKSIKIISKTEDSTVKGIYQIKYQVPKVDKQLRPTGDYKKPRNKTVYDPAIHSDDKILQLGQEAAAKGLDNAIANNNSQFDSIVNGITFRVYVDLVNKVITNVHPK